MAVGVDTQPYLVGDPAVVSADGQWRLVERDLLNMRNPNMFEQQFELSPDGTILALGDEFGVVFLHLASGTTTRVATQLKDPVLHSGLSHGRPCAACGHGMHTYVSCSDSCDCVPPTTPGEY